MDQELRRISGLLTPLRELEQRLYKIENDFGKEAGKRARKYIADRFKYLFDWVHEES